MNKTKKSEERQNVLIFEDCPKFVSTAAFDDLGV